MPISEEQVERHRAHTFRLQTGRKVTSKEEAVQFVNERGFVYFWPIKGVTLPSLWSAVAGDRPVANEHDDPGHVTWGWKDSMLGARQWYYAKVLRGKATIIALDTLPYFYALSENYGDPEHDYRQLYEDGLLSREAKIVYETLLRAGPLDTVRLRRESHMTRKKSDSPFQRAMTQLQRDFKIVPIGVAEAGAWRYSFIYEVVHRQWPELPDQARPIERRVARAHLVKQYLAAIGMASEGDVRKLFQWRLREVRRTLAALQEEGLVASVAGNTPSQTQYVWGGLTGAA